MSAAWWSEACATVHRNRLLPDELVDGKDQEQRENRLTTAPIVRVARARSRVQLAATLGGISIIEHPVMRWSDRPDGPELLHLTGNLVTNRNHFRPDCLSAFESRLTLCQLCSEAISELYLRQQPARCALECSL